MSDGGGSFDVPGRLRELSRSGALELPVPGAGHTLARFRALAAFGAEDTVLGRLVEAHTDAAAILHELGGAATVPGQLWGVWAAEPPDPVLHARHTSSGWVLEGRKLWCSGAHLCTHALVTARTGTDRRLFAIPLAQPATTPVPDSWPAVGMRDSDSGAVDFDHARAEPIGAPGAYLTRPGFWHGAVGVAASWYGSACAAARPLHAYAASGHADEHALAHLGAIATVLRAARDGLARAAAEIDDDPAGDPATARIRARLVRAVVEQAVTTTLDRVGRALGATPLCADAAHARRVADLTVYVRQSHAEADLAGLGRDLAATDPVRPDL
ncbi:acyl-CoA dehydrogenase family protein [Nocardia sp. BMG111209]|uniref:acyl-CoA dehydrogenase family protein n=1 Tax=Nocardia sp. BMG111209 TaxID=1160137 RepID=UPI00035F6750|nr:acyl-CoA dehydrogenase family protein [Nocardia sp. BMG111209]